MAKNYGQGKGNFFEQEGGGEEPSQRSSARERDAAIYGELPLPETGRQVAKPTPLGEVRPDLAQPRRAIPAIVRGKWNGNPAEIPALMEVWRARVADSLGYKFDVKPYLLAEENAADIKSEDPLVTGYMALVQLASTIRNRLLHPVTAYRDEHGGYTLIAGERRLLAHHLLALHVDKKKFSKIPLQAVDSPDVWAQSSENTARESLNAIGKARQLAILLMDLHKDEMTFTPYGEIIAAGGTDLDYYKQGDLDAKHGTSARIQQAMGMNNRASLTRYRLLLRLPYDVWQAGDESNEGLFKLLEIYDQLHGTNHSGKSVTSSNTFEADDTPQTGKSVSRGNTFEQPLTGSKSLATPAQPERVLSALMGGARVFDVKLGKEGRVAMNNADGTIQVQYEDGDYRSQRRDQLMPLDDMPPVEANPPAWMDDIKRLPLEPRTAPAFTPDPPGERVPVYQNLTEQPRATVEQVITKRKSLNGFSPGDVFYTAAGNRGIVVEVEQGGPGVRVRLDADPSMLYDELDRDLYREDPRNTREAVKLSRLGFEVGDMVWVLPAQDNGMIESIPKDGGRLVIVRLQNGNEYPCGDEDLEPLDAGAATAPPLPIFKTRRPVSDENKQMMVVLKALMPFAPMGHGTLWEEVLDAMERGEWEGLPRDIENDLRIFHADSIAGMERVISLMVVIMEQVLEAIKPAQ